MANIVFNIAKGQPVEAYRRVKTADPTNCALIVVLLASSGLVSDATLKDYDNLSVLLAGASNEATNTGYARKVLVAADLAAVPAPDDTNDRFDIDIPDQVWATVANDGTGAIGKLLVCYDADTTGGTDANILPLTAHDFVTTPDGNSITAIVNVAGFFRAAE